MIVDKATKSVDTFDDEDNDAYETIEFSDSSHLYTEPIRTYGTLRRSTHVETKQMTEPKVARKSNKVKALKKSSGMSNLKLLSQSDDEDFLIEKEEHVKLRPKTPIDRNKVIPVGMIDELGNVVNLI